MGSSYLGRIYVDYWSLSKEIMFLYRIDQGLTSLSNLCFAVKKLYGSLVKKHGLL
jgi:hypothetical protein